MKVFYHNDLDGKCSAAVVLRNYPALKPEDLYEINYGMQFPWDDIKDGESVFMVDFCLQPFVDMEKLYNKTNGFLVWIDHHISAIKEYENYVMPGIRGLRRTGIAACQLTWEYFNPKIPEPGIVNLLGRYDIWDLNQEVLEFQMGMRLDDFDLFHPFWSIMLDTTGTYDSVQEPWLWDIKNRGRIVIQWEDVRAKEYCRNYANEIFWMGYRCVALNVGRCSSTFFDSTYNLKDYDIYIAYNRLPSQKWTVSLYSEKVDVSEIAKSLGGGGHKGASGFQCNSLPFDV